MTLEDAALVSQIASAVLVAASLVFVGVQMRLNTNAVKASMSQAHSAIYHQVIASIIDDGEFAEIWRKGLAQPTALEEAERIRFIAYTSGLFRFYESSRVQWLHGNLDAEHWHTIERQATTLAGQPGVQSWWTLRREWHSEDFRDWFEALTPAPAERLYGAAD